MTDNEIVKTLIMYSGTYANYGVKRVAEEALDLINRQKAEIERLNDVLNATIAGQETLQQYIVTDKVEAVKEIFEKVEERLAVHSFTSNSTEYTDGMLDCMEWVDSRIGELKKEMVGEG